MTQFNHIPAKFDYDDLNRTTTKNGRVYVSPSGIKYPSITTVLSEIGKESLQAWRQRVGEEEANKIGAQASRRGTAVHDLMEKYIRGDEINMGKLMPLYRTSLIKLSKVMDERLTDWYVQEKKMWSDHLGVAGQMDLAGRFDGAMSVVDFKTSRKVKKKEWISSYFIQECAYSIMYEERTGVSLPNLVIVMDVDNHDPIVFKEHRDNWVGPLKEAIENYHREMRCRPL